MAEGGALQLADVGSDPPPGLVRMHRADAHERDARLEHGADERVVVVRDHEHDAVDAAVEERRRELGRRVRRHVEEAEPVVERRERERRQQLLEERVQQHVRPGERDRERERVRAAGGERPRDRARAVGEPLGGVEHALPRRLVHAPLAREDVRDRRDRDPGCLGHVEDRRRLRRVRHPSHAVPQRLRTGQGCRPRRTAIALRGSARAAVSRPRALDVEADVQDVAVLDDVRLALEPLQALARRLRVRAGADEVVRVDHLGRG